MNLNPTAVERSSRRTLASRGLPDWLISYLFLAPAAAVFLGLITYPLIDGMATSLTDRGLVGAGAYVGLSNFLTLFQDPNYLRAVGNSVLLTCGAVALKLVLGMLGALLLHQQFRFRGLFRALVFLPWAVPGLIAGLSWKWIYDEQAGVLNYLALVSGAADMPVRWLSDPTVAMLSIGIAMVWHGLPFFIMMLLAGLATIPRDLYEAAAIDGAGALRRFRYVTLPHLRDVIAITVMLSTIWTFNSFHMVFILTGGGPAMQTHILPTLAYEYGIARNQLGLGSAVIVSVVPVFVVIIVFLTRRMLRDRLR